MSDDPCFELPASEVFGPQGAYVVALIERARRLTLDEASALADARYDARHAVLTAAWAAAWAAARYDARHAVLTAAREAAWGAVLDAAWGSALDAVLYAMGDAALDAAWGAAWGAVLDAAWDSAGALVVRDLITAEDYDTLTRPWRTVIGPIHPDDDTRRECAHCGGDGFEPMTGKFKESHACFVCGGEGEQ